jgi:hypothetical protein
MWVKPTLSQTRLVEVFDLTIPDDEAQKIRTVGDAIDYVVRQRVTPAAAR